MAMGTRAVLNIRMITGMTMRKTLMTLDMEMITAVISPIAKKTLAWEL